MAHNDPPEIPLPPPADPDARCPWCSAPVASPDDVTCGACGATLQGDAAIEIPGVTAIDGDHASQAAMPRKAHRAFGGLFAGGNEQKIPPPSEADLPALAMPDAEVRREMLRIQLDAELVNLTARAAALAAERGIPTPVSGAEPETGAVPGPDAPSAAPPAAVTDEQTRPGPTQAGDATPPEDDARP